MILTRLTHVFPVSTMETRIRVQTVVTEKYLKPTEFFLTQLLERNTLLSDSRKGQKINNLNGNHQEHLMPTNLRPKNETTMLSSIAT
jgi:hypothetical protein